MAAPPVATTIFSVIPVPIQFAYTVKKLLEDNIIIGQMIINADGDITSFLPSISNSVDWGNTYNSTLNNPNAFINNVSQVGLSTTYVNVVTIQTTSTLNPTPVNMLYNSPVEYNVKITFSGLLGQNIILSSQAVIYCGVPLTPIFETPINSTTNIIPAAVVGITTPLAVYKTVQDTGELQNFLSVLIDWGDGTPLSMGFVSNTPNPQIQGQIIYQIYNTNSHKYPNTNATYTVQFTVTNETGGIVYIQNLINVDVQNQSINVSYIEPEPVEFSGFEGNSLPVGTIIGQFTVNADANIDTTYLLANGSVIIDWGDSSPLYTIVNADNLSYNNIDNTTVFIVQVGTGNNYTYKEARNYNVKITVSIGPIDGAVTTYIGSQAVIQDSPLRLLSAVPIASPTNILPSNTLLATFSDGNTGNVNPDDFWAFIDWGDGSPMSLGNIAYTSMGAYFSITSGHTYPPNNGNYIIKIVLSDVDKAQLIIRNSATITFNPSSFAINLIEPEPIEFTGFANSPIPAGTVIGQYSLETNISPTLLNIMGGLVTVDWGDGSGSNNLTDPTNFQFNTNGTETTVILMIDSTATNSHTYASTGNYNVKITVTYGNLTSIIGSFCEIPTNGGGGGGCNPVIGYDVRAYDMVGCKGKRLYFIGTFTDLSGGVLPVNPNYLTNVTIIWGDGHHPKTVVPVQVMRNTVGTSQYIVRANHKYKCCGVFNLILTVNGVPAVAEITINDCCDDSTSCASSCHDKKNCWDESECSSHHGYGIQEEKVKEKKKKKHSKKKH